MTKSSQTTTRDKLLSIYNISTCPSFNKVIELYLTESALLPNDSPITLYQEHIDSLYKEGKQSQISLAESIGIKRIDNTWSSNDSIRDLVPPLSIYYKLDRDSNKGFKTSIGSLSTVPVIYTFPTKELAEQEAKIYALMMEMRHWTRHHNKIDNYTPDYSNNNELKYGLSIKNKEVEVTVAYIFNNALFYCAVKTDTRAKQMFNQFKSQIEEIIPYL